MDYIGLGRHTGVAEACQPSPLFTDKLGLHRSLGLLWSIETYVGCAPLDSHWTGWNIWNCSYDMNCFGPPAPNIRSGATSGAEYNSHTWEFAEYLNI